MTTGRKFRPTNDLDQLIDTRIGSCSPLHDPGAHVSLVLSGPTMESDQL